MKNFMKKLKGKMSIVTMFNALALVMAIDSVNAACMWIMYQPEVPEEMDAYRK